MGMDLNDLLRALGQAANTQPGASDGGNDPLTSILGGLLGGGAQQPPKPQSRSGKGSVQGSSKRKDRLPQQQDGGGIADILSSVLGGGTPQQQTTPSGGGGLGDLLGGLLGGGAPSRGSKAGGNPITAPLVNLVVEKTGLPPAIAEMAVTFAITQILGSLSSNAQGGRQTGYNSLARQLGTDSGVDGSYLSSSGLAQQFADQSGLDLATATNALEHTYGLIQPAMAGGSLPIADSAPSPARAPTKSTKKVSATKSSGSKLTKRKSR